MQKTINGVIVILSLSITPVMVFVSTATKLYLINQQQFVFNYRVFYPFFVPFFATLIVGVVLYGLSSNRWIRVALCFYYIFGPFFLFYNTLSDGPIRLLNSIGGTLIALAFCLSVSFVMAQKVSLKPARHLIALFALILLLTEIYLFAANFQTPQDMVTSPQSNLIIPQSKSASEGISFDVLGKSGQENKLPNVYILLLDAYQTDLFEEVLTPEIRAKMGGFIYFPNNAAVLQTTVMSLPAIFSGEYYSLKEPQQSYVDKSFTKMNSIIYMLKLRGYSIHSYTVSDILLTTNMSKFDAVNVYELNQSMLEQFSIPRGLWELWIYRNLPLFVSEYVLGPELVERISGFNVRMIYANISAYYGFLNYLADEEKYLPSTNRFTFLYLPFPHGPNIFNDDCSITEYGEDVSTVTQARCSYDFIKKFIDTLKGLNRFQDSLIIVCADHGSTYKSEEKGFLWPISRALLLVKPSGVSDEKDMITSDFESSVLDIAPTIYDTLSIKSPLEKHGLSLLDHGKLRTNRKRYFYSFAEKGPEKWTDEMTKHVVEGERLKKLETIRIQNNKLPDWR
jgi:hypothetical protein